MIGNYFESELFNSLYNYDGELGVIYSKEKSEFILWAPTASEVKLALYGSNGYDYECKEKEVINMKNSDNGIWRVQVNRDLNGEYYNYIVNVNGDINVLVDPYARAVGVNGNRGMIVDLEETNPANWENDKKPEFRDATDAIIYEVHVRDLTVHESSGIEEVLKGKFKGLSKEGSCIPGTNITTGIDHIKEMGFTHVHILPAFDYASVDETRLYKPQFNWGYDPKNYNAPEGSYSSNPYLGKIRIKEFKEMVQEFHKNNLRVVMDVVYNHTFDLKSNLNLAVPGYYYRQNKKGDYTNGSGCGNETASERYMFRKYIIDSVVYWAKEYHIDGFRFDLMGLHDIETMKQIRKELDNIDPSILIYGEGWAGGETPLKEEEAALKKNTYKYGDLQIAAFSDDCRDGVKGHVFYEKDPGFVNGKSDSEENIKFLTVASTPHKEVDVKKAIYSNEFWANEPYQTVTYASAHDNYTLWDKLHLVNNDADEKELAIMNKLIAAIILTSQGIVFMQSGEEFARSKVDESGRIIENSYCSSDFVNSIDWTRKEKYKELMDYYKGLISLRKRYKAFRMNTNKEIRENISFLNKGKNFNENNVVAYIIDSRNIDKKCNKVAVIFNANNTDVAIKLPEKNWNLVVNENTAGINTIEKIKEDIILVPRKSAYVLIK